MLAGFLGSTAKIHSSRWGDLTFESVSFSAAIDGDLMMTTGAPFECPEPLVRIHSECVFAERFQSDFCDCADQFDLAMQRLVASKKGIMFYLRVDGRGAGLAAKVKATALEVAGMDTFSSRRKIGVAPEGRDFSQIGRFLFSRGLRKAKLLTNNPSKAQGLIDAGIEVVLEPLIVPSCNANVKALYKAKAELFGHTIPANSWKTD